MKHTYQISGMTCNGCKRHVEETLQGIEGIKSVQVNLEKAEAKVIMETHVPLEKMQKALAENGGRYMISVDRHEDHHHHNHHHDQGSSKTEDHEGGSYYCPMLCEGDKKYDQPGDCPVCGMDLEKEEKMVRSGKTQYTCPMHPEIIREQPGSCPICGMDLEPMSASQEADNQEEKAFERMLRKFWLAVAFTLPVFFITMSEMIGISLTSIANERLWGWIQFGLSTPVVFYACREFFVRGYRSIINRSPNMWTLISLGAGSAYLFSILPWFSRISSLINSKPKEDWCTCTLRQPRLS